MNSLDRQPARTPAVPLVPLHGVQTEAAEGGMFGHAVWQQVRDTALDVSRREPLLLRRMQQLVLRHAGPAAILASVLARRMASEDLPEPVLQELMQRVLESDESAMQHATRDLAAVKERDPACTDLLHVVLNLKGYQALQAHRVGHALWRSGRKELAFALAAAVIVCALGYGAFPVAVSVILEAALLSVVGALIGAGYAWLVYDGVQSGFGQNVFHLSVSPAMIGMAVLWAVVVAFLGGLLPSIRAARRPVVEALRAT